MDSGWHPDPSRQHELRYWDGSRWTEHVVDRGVQSVSPLPPAPGTREQAAAGGTSSSEPREQLLPPAGQVPLSHGSAATGGWSGGTPTAAASPAPAASSTAAASPAPSSPAGGFGTGVAWGGRGAPGQETANQDAPVRAAPGHGAPTPGGPGRTPGGIVGELVDGRFRHGESVGPSLQNPKLLRVRLTEPFLAKQGAMVAYQGELSFHYQGAGMGRVLKRALTGEGLALMRVEGRGDCYIADTAKAVHLLQLENSGISVNGANVLAFSQSLEWNVERVKGAAMATGGLFNTTLRGTGWLAIVTDGDPVVLDAGYAPTFADTDAIVAWSADLQTSLHSTMSAGALIGRGSGEAVQVVFQGRGFVIVQPSETVKVPGRS